LIPAGVLLVLGIMLGAKVVKNSERSLLLKLHACCETDQKCLRLKTDMAVQKWLQRSFLAFQGNFKPLELLVEKHRGIVNSKLSESQNLKQTFSELESACEVKKTAPQRGTKPATVAA
jgi:hypothetical protein